MAAPETQTWPGRKQRRTGPFPEGHQPATEGASEKCSDRSRPLATVIGKILVTKIDLEYVRWRAAQPLHNKSGEDFLAVVGKPLMVALPRQPPKRPAKLIVGGIAKPEETPSCDC